MFVGTAGTGMFGSLTTMNGLIMMLFMIAFPLPRVVAAAVQFPSQVAFPVTQPSNRTEGQWITIDAYSNILFTGKLSVPNEDPLPYIVQMNQFLEVQWQVSLAEVKQQYRSFSATGIASLTNGGPNGGYVVTGTKSKWPYITVLEASGKCISRLAFC